MRSKRLLSVALLTLGFAFTNNVFAIDLGMWLKIVGLESVINAVDKGRSGGVTGPTYAYSEPSLVQQLKKGEVQGTPEQITMLSNGPVYITKSGIEPIGDRRPLRLSQDGTQTDLLFLITTNMSSEYLLQTAQAAVQMKAVLVLRGLLDGSVDATIKAVAPLLDVGAVIEVNPMPESLFGKRLVAKAPIFVQVQVNEQGGYGCKSTASKDCIPYFATIGAMHRPFGDYNIAKTVRFAMRSSDQIAASDPANQAFRDMLDARLSGVSASK